MASNIPSSDTASADFIADLAILSGLISAMDILAGEPGRPAANALYAVIRQANPLVKALEERVETLFP